MLALYELLYVLPSLKLVPEDCILIGVTLEVPMLLAGETEVEASSESEPSNAGLHFTALTALAWLESRRNARIFICIVFRPPLECELIKQWNSVAEQISVMICVTRNLQFGLIDIL